jgi:hypothetical protein
VKTQRTEPFIVKTITGKRVYSQIWDDSTPLALGHPFRFVLERTEEGVRVRDLKGGHQEVTEEQIQRGAKVSFGSNKGSVETSLFLKQATPVTPSYLPKVTDGKSLAPLFAYAGLRRSLISCNAVHSAYVAYERGKPAFAFYQEADGFRIKTLANGMRLKFKGEQPKVGTVGEVWKLTPEELSVATIFKGWYWWRFNRVQTPDVPILTQEQDEENQLFSRVSWILAGTIFALWVLLNLFVQTPPVDQEKLSPPVTVQNKVRIFSKNRPKMDAPAAMAAAPGDPAPAEPQAKPELPKAQSQPEEKPAAHTAPSKSVATAKSVSKAKQDHSLAQMKSLKQALSGLKSLHGQTMMAPAATKASSSESLFTGSVGTVGQTAVAPLQAGTGVQVHGFGGKSSGYAQTGVSATGSGGTGSFVSLESKGYRVDEGLTKDEVGEVIHSHMGEVRYCHEAAMLANPKMEGKLVANFSINAKGIVSASSVDSSTLGDAQLVNCVIDRLKTWRFPKPRGGVTVTVAYPFLFKILERE